MFHPIEAYPRPQVPWSQAPLLLPLLCCVAGVAIGALELCSIWVWGIASVIIAAIAAIMGLKWYGQIGQKRGVYAWMLASFAIFCALAALTTRSLKTIDIEWDDKPQMWTGEVKQLVKRGTDTDTYDILLACGTRTPKVRIYLEKAQERSLNAGDRVAFWATIKKADRKGNPEDFDYYHYLLTHRISGHCYVKANRMRLLDPSSHVSLTTRLLRLRQKMIDQYQSYFTHTNLSILAALTLGDKSMLNTDVRQVFADTGTSHILALSGLHMGLLFALLNMPLMMLSRRGRWVKGVMTLVIVLLLWMYVMLAGGALSLVRSACMLSMMQLGEAIGRGEHRGMNNLSFAGIVILVCDPLAVFDVGFQLSFAAVFSIIIVNQYVWNRFPLPEWKETREVRRKREEVIGKVYDFFKKTIYPFICVSLSAQWGTFPFVAYYFHTFSPYAVIANFVVIPAAYLLLCGALFFFLLPFSMLRGFLAMVMSGVVSVLVETLHHIATWPWATLQIRATPLSVLVVVGIPIAVYVFHECRMRRNRRRVMYVSFALLSLTFVGENVWTYYHRLRPCIIVYKTPRSTIMHFIQSEDNSCLYSTISKDSTFTQLDYVKRNFWEKYHFSYPQFASTDLLAKNEGLYVFKGRSILVLRDKVSSLSLKNKSNGPLMIDLLIVADGCRMRYEALHGSVNPRQVVLSASLSPRIKKDWVQECRMRHITCWDIATDGAYTLFIE